MENEKNRDFIVGGLPLGSNDFVDPTKAVENKSKLLAALDKINKLHSTKMIGAVDNTPEPSVESSLAGMKMDEPKEEPTLINPMDSVAPVEDEYILAKDIIVNDEPNVEVTAFEEPMFENNEAIPEFDHSEFVSSEPQPEDAGYPEGENLGEPMFVLTDAEVESQNSKVASEKKKSKGKTGKSGKGKKEYTPVCSKDEVKAGKGVAWLAYILFFIPLLINGKNAFVRHHANEGLEINLMDILGAGLICVGYFLEFENKWLTLALMVAMIAGIVMLVLTTITKIFMIILSLCGKEANSPWFGRTKMIKVKK